MCHGSGGGEEDGPPAQATATSNATIVCAAARCWIAARSFVPRHNSGSPAEIDALVAGTGFKSLAALVDATVPAAIRRKDDMAMGNYTAGMTESEFLDYFKCVGLAARVAAVEGVRGCLAARAPWQQHKQLKLHVN